MLHASPLDISPGIRLWSGALDAGEQRSLVEDVMRRAADAPFYRPTMPRSGKPFSVEETNFGSLGWLSDTNGYRYETKHPLTQRPWPAMPELLLKLWRDATGYRAPPECCLVNLYRAGARMGLHQDRDEQAFDAPVLSVSLGDDALFRIGGATRRGPSVNVKLSSGDVLAFGGPARLAFHGIDRLMSGSSQLVPGGGRINLTLRRVKSPTP
jgi:DNA oxidative demethylase